MTALLHAELIKLRTTRTFLAVAAVAVAASMILVALVGLLTEPTRESVLVDVFTSDTSSFFIMILAVVGITGEWRHRTIASSLLAAPDRLRFLASKTLAFSAAGTVLSVLISSAVTVVGVSVLWSRGLPLPGAGELLAQYGRNAIVAALLGALGVGLGALVRTQVIAIVTMLLLSLVAESVVVAFAPEVGRFSPFGALPAAAGGIPPDAVGFDDMELFSPAVGVLLLLAWIAAAFAGGAALLRRRDLH